MTGKQWLLIIAWLVAIASGLYLYGLNNSNHANSINEKPQITNQHQMGHFSHSGVIL